MEMQKAQTLHKNNAEPFFQIRDVDNGYEIISCVRYERNVLSFSNHGSVGADGICFPSYPQVRKR